MNTHKHTEVVAAAIVEVLSHWPDHFNPTYIQAERVAAWLLDPSVTPLGYLSEGLSCDFEVTYSAFQDDTLKLWLEGVQENDPPTINVELSVVECGEGYEVIAIDEFMHDHSVKVEVNDQEKIQVVASAPSTALKDDKTQLIANSFYLHLVNADCPFLSRDEVFAIAGVVLNPNTACANDLKALTRPFTLHSSLGWCSVEVTSPEGEYVTFGIHTFTADDIGQSFGLPSQHAFDNLPFLYEEDGRKVIPFIEFD